MMRSSGKAAHLRNCSRREPSQVVKRQSMPSARGSFLGIVFEPHVQVFDVDPVLGAARGFLHADQRGNGDKADIDRAIERLDQGSFILTPYSLA
ncbi:MAG: hypothetical protein ACREXW_07590 [Gammaproteobacteria bacterium]